MFKAVKKQIIGPIEALTLDVLTAPTMEALINKVHDLWESSLHWVQEPDPYNYILAISRSKPQVYYIIYTGGRSV